MLNMTIPNMYKELFKHSMFPQNKDIPKIKNLHVSSNNSPT